MEVKTNPEQSDSRSIPRSWKAKSLGDFVALQRGHDLTERERHKGDIPVMGSAGPNGFHDSARANGPGVVVGRSGASFGQAHYCEVDYWPHNTALYVTDFFENVPLFCFYLLDSIDFSRHNSGGAQQSLNRNFIAPIKVTIPPPKEQEAIAEALCDADALIEGLEQLIAKKRNLKQGAMKELLSGKTRLPGFGGRWEVKRLGELLSRLANGAVYKTSNSLGLPITRIETIADGTIDCSRLGSAKDSVDLEIYKMVFGDILFSHINSLDHIGKVAQFFGEQDLYHGMNLLLLRANQNADSRFIYFWLTSVAARRKARNLARQAVSQASINTTELKALEILLPPLPEQTAIAAILSDMDAEIAALEAKLAKARQIKQGMMQELLTGRVRLI